METGERHARAPASAGWLRLAIAGVACAVGIMAGFSAIGAIWEGGITDRLLQARAFLLDAPEKERSPVAVVGLDMKALTSDRLRHIPRVFMTGAFADAGKVLFDAGAKGLGFDFVFAFSSDDFIDPQTGEARLRGYDGAFLKFLYDNRGRAVVARTASNDPHRRIAAAIGGDGVKSTQVLADSDGVIRRHAPASDLAASPSFKDALLALAGSTQAKPYRSLPLRRVQSEIPYLSLVDLIACADTPVGRAQLQEFARNRVIFSARPCRMKMCIPTQTGFCLPHRLLPVLLAPGGPRQWGRRRRASSFWPI